MRKELQNCIKKYLPENPNEPIIIALSGGVDSMVLFHVCSALHKKIVVAHVNHKQRLESNQEYEALRSLASSKKLPFEGYVFDSKIAGNFQDESRKKRRAFFISVAKKYNANKTFLGHHNDDQLETFLMRFIKGYSLQTLTGIEDSANDAGYTFIHPFLNVSKDTLLHFAKENNITFFEDSSNKSLDYTRNRIRNQLLPYLESENSGIKNTLNQFIEQFNDLNALLDAEAKAFLDTYNDGYTLEAFNFLNPLVKTRVLQLLLQKQTNYKHPSHKLIQTLIALLMSDSTTLQHPIGDDYTLLKEYNTFTIIKTPKVKDNIITIAGEGTYKFDEEHSYLVTHEKLDHIYINYCGLWYNEKVFPLYLRYRQDGDRIKLNYGTKKLKSLFIDKKIPPSQRASIILLANDEEVLWIPLLKMCKATEAKKEKILYIYEVKNVR